VVICIAFSVHFLLELVAMLFSFSQRCVSVAVTESVVCVSEIHEDPRDR
jgi:hypothetical protein